MFPSKLKLGDEVRIIAPSRSLAMLSSEIQSIAEKRLLELGIKVSYAQRAREKDEFVSSPIESRVQDLHEAFQDEKVKGILTVIGGFNVNQILKYLDYDLIKKNPKILCGFSDITALSNAIYAKTGLVTYSGPHFSTFGILKGTEYTREYFQKCLMETASLPILPADSWSDDQWWLDQEKREFIKNEGHLLINEGHAEGKILGGNLCTLNLLQGTEFMPDIKEAILFLEDDGETRDVVFDRDLQSLLHQPDFGKVKGLVIGRFQKTSQMTKEKLIKIIKTKKELDKIPVIANVDFGHTSPMITFPIGGKAKLSAEKGSIQLEIVEH